MPTKLLWKLPGVILAALSLVLLSIPALGLQFSVTFMDMLRYAGDLISGVLQLNLIEAAIRKALAPFAIDFHPAPYWHHAFVLLWLLHGSMARAFLTISVSSRTLLLFIWAGITALVAGALSGMVPLNSIATVSWPLAGLCAFMFGMFTSMSDGSKDTYFGAAFCVFGVLSLTAFGYMIEEPMPQVWGLAVPSPGLLLVAGMVAFIGVFGCLVGLYFAASEGVAFDDGFISMGLDIVGAFGFAAAFAIAGQYLL